MWYVEYMHSPFRSEWVRDTMPWKEKRDAASHAAQFLMNYPLRQIAVRLTKTEGGDQ